MREEWEVTVLGELADIVMGQSPVGETCNGAGNGAPLLNGPTEFGSSYPQPVQYTTDPKKFAEIGDLLFCVRGSTTGRMNWADRRYAIGRGLAALRHKQGKDYQPFLKGVIDYYLPSLLVEATGSTFPNVSSQQLNQLSIQVPDLLTQRRIAAILSALDEKIELNRQTNQTLEAIAQTLFKEWFVDFNFPGATGEMQESELGPIPVGWKVEEVNDICVVTDYVANGSFASLAANVTYKSELDYAVLIRLVDYNRDFRSDGFVFIDEKAYNFLSKSKLVGGEIIIANVGANAGSIFRTPILNRPMSLGPNAIMIKPNIYSHYLYLYFKSIAGRTLIDGIITGSAQPKFNKTDFRNIQIVKPNEMVILQFNAVYEAIENILNNNILQSANLSQILDHLLPQIMSGEIIV